MEMLYRSSKDSRRGSAAVEDSHFTLPGRQQQRHFKSVYTDTNNNNDSMLQQQVHTQSQKYLLPVQPEPSNHRMTSDAPLHHHMS